MGKLLKDHEKICWPPLLVSAAIGDDDRSTPDYDANLVAREVEPILIEKCVQVKFGDPGGRGSRAPTTLSFGVKDTALLKPLFKFLSNQRGKTVKQIGDMQVNF